VSGLPYSDGERSNPRQRTRSVAEFGERESLNGNVNKYKEKKRRFVRYDSFREDPREHFLTIGTLLFFTLHVSSAFVIL